MNRYKQHADHDLGTLQVLRRSQLNLTIRQSAQPHFLLLDP